MGDAGTVVTLLIGKGVRLDVTKGHHDGTTDHDEHDGIIDVTRLVLTLGVIGKDVQLSRKETTMDTMIRRVYGRDEAASRVGS
jgi:hypothetical protein